MSWINKIFWFFRISLLGFSSGLPFLLTLSTLAVWLKECSVSKTMIGLFGLATLPYALKFFWAPFVDTVVIPYLGPRLGQRRSWALLAQVNLFASLIGLGASDPQNALGWAAIMATLVSFWASIQDLALEAYRIERTSLNTAGLFAAANYLGFRAGMVLSGAGALFLSTAYGWFLTYNVMALFLMLSMATVLMCPEPPHLSKGYILFNWQEKIKDNLRTFFADHDWPVVVLLIIFYKTGDTALNVMNTPFLLELGFSVKEIASMAKGLGILAMTGGGLMGCILIDRFGVFNALLTCSVLHTMACLFCLVQNAYGPNLHVLAITTCFESLTCGMGASSFIAYLTMRAQKPCAATCYSLLTSMGSGCRVVLSIGAGWAADLFSWEYFFLGAALICVVFTILLISVPTHFNQLKVWL